LKFANILVHGRPHLAVDHESALYVVPPDWDGATHAIHSFEDLLARQSDAREWAATLKSLAQAAPHFPVVLPTTFAWRPIAERPSKIICVGRNYLAHVQETRRTVSEEPVLFSKFANALAACDAVIPIPPVAQQVDYEAELVMIIGRTCHAVSPAAALSYVAAYTAGNDISARDLQHRSSQWLIGKSLDAFGPVGPYCVTSDEIKNPQALSIQLRRNGQLCQDANTEQMIFSCAEVVAYASELWTLEPGDIIFTGTPGGVIFGQPPETRQWLKPGDEVSVTIEKIGTLTNTFGGPVPKE